MTMQYIGALLGREAVIDFPESTAEVRYTVRGICTGGCATRTATSRKGMNA
jgi:hypothetical protein